MTNSESPPGKDREMPLGMREIEFNDEQRWFLEGFRNALILAGEQRDEARARADELHRRLVEVQAEVAEARAALERNRGQRALRILELDDLRERFDQWHQRVLGDLQGEIP